MDKLIETIEQKLHAQDKLLALTKEQLLALVETNKHFLDLLVSEASTLISLISEGKIEESLVCLERMKEEAKAARELVQQMGASNDE